ncbi:probable Thioredoxin-3, mitochondrial [Zygosaccharomyces bailii]|nr:probable Thioredoxin-3, mitochondrial [Zygosaccharomyces bailii]
MLRTTVRALNSVRYSSYTSIPKLSSKQHFEQALKKPGLSVFDFYATWCGPCKAMAPILGKLQEDYAKVSFYKIDVDESPDVAKDCGVTAMPTFVLAKDGSILGKVVGANPGGLEKGIKENQ